MKWKSYILPFCGLLVAAALAHGAGLTNGFTNWDDPFYLIRNPLTINPLGSGAAHLLLTPEIGYPIPLTMLSYAAQRVCFDLTPLGFHIVSITLHGIVVCLCAALALRLGAGRLAATAAAAVFAVHPLTVEPVAWVVGQKDLLATLLGIAALWVRASPKGTGPLRATTTVVFVLLSLMAKPSTVFLPAMLLLVDIALGRSVGRQRNLVVYCVAAVLAIIATALALHGHAKLGAPPSQNFGLRSLAEAGWALTLHLGHIIWPDPLTARYFAPTGAVLILRGIAGVFCFGLLLLLALTNYKRGNRVIAFAISTALLALAPASGIIPLTRGPADSYLYFPLALASIGLAHWFSNAFSIPSRRKYIVVGVAASLVVLTLVSRHQSRHWSNAVTLWTHVASTYPDHPVALMRLGDSYLYTAQPQAALSVYTHIQNKHPDFVTSQLGHGNTLELLGRFMDAEKVFADAATRGKKPSYLYRYARFLVDHPAVEPSAQATAKTALAHIAPFLATRGKRPMRLSRAIELLDRFALTKQAEAIRTRLKALGHPSKYRQ